MALTYIKETHRTQGVTFEVAVCAECLAREVAPEFHQSHTANGYRVEVRPWAGEDRECSYCDTRHEDDEPELVENFETEPDDQHDAEDER